MFLPHDLCYHGIRYASVRPSRVGTVSKRLDESSMEATLHLSHIVS